MASNTKSRKCIEICAGAEVWKESDWTQAPGAGQQKVPWDGVAVHPANVARRDPEDLVLRFPSVETRAKELILVLLAQVSIRSSLTFRSMKNKT